MKKVHLVVIDPQNSFCKVVPQQDQQVLHDGELCVTGAWEDMGRLAKMVKRVGSKLDDIHVTLDSHHLMHIAHPIWFIDDQGNNPSPFTLMEEKDGAIVGSDGKVYQTFSVAVYNRTLSYLKELKASNRYPHCIWMPHCLIGTAGHNVVAPLMEELLSWERNNHSAVDYVTKGSNYFVEHFSAVRAEVVDPDDPTTQLNTQFIQTIMEGDIIAFAGEAGSHCLANTVRDIADSFQDDSFVKKCVLLEDATSPVPGFESLQDQFIADMKGRGMQVSTCAGFLS